MIDDIDVPPPNDGGGKDTIPLDVKGINDASTGGCPSVDGNEKQGSRPRRHLAQTNSTTTVIVVNTGDKPYTCS